MDVGLLVAAGSAAIAIAAVLWALRVTDGARGGVDAWKKRARDLEDKVAWADAIFGAHPGIGLILLPIMIYHPLQLVICGMLAQRWGQEKELVP